MDILKQKLTDFAKERGIDVLGFAPKSRFEALEKEHNPFSIFPEAETVILLGKRICRGSLRGVEEGSNFEDYVLYGRNWLEDIFLTTACYDMTRLIEDNGWEAVPIFPNPTEVRPQGIPVAEGRPAPNVHPDFDYAAVACGVAEISYNGILLTPDFGSRQRFHMIITDAVIEPTPVLDKSICDLCGKCADACPLHAISKTEYKTVTICEKNMKVARIDYSLCAKCKNGAVPNRFISSGKPDRVAALCNRTCMEHLEQAGLVNNVFSNRFRQGRPWALDAEGKYVDDAEV
ncbi:MAG: 4Fe-4S binding protein [Clostridiaceae bacterium]|jgi:epoxyqueuosine reductase QueG|nr:4Fe-4S binding protein [Clostridiaceae bacterium]